ncbi:MAG: acetoacetate metabolism regulatory protein AtoC [Gemmatimonadota bacterium]|nr:MAG: acetoacetate metabolism regulatory protein AtoC [Gemmatimonadota bacterium]
MANILIVDDEKNLRWSLRIALEEKGHQVEEAPSGEDCLEMLADKPKDIVFLDVRLPGRDGMEVLQEIRRAHEDCIVIIMSAFGEPDASSEAVSLGAYYFLSKPFELRKVISLVDDAMVNIETLREARNARQIRIGNRESDRFIIGSSECMHDVVEIIEKIAAATASTVLIQGESGTGKELVAKAIHHLSYTHERRPFMAINCAGLPENLLESELFGHEKGAFTDARDRKRGLLEIANTGTLFLDEIGEMPLGLQARLLRVLETKTFRRIGGVSDIEVGLRIVAATNRDLKREAQEGRFREDLFFRLNVVPINIPPLRDRVQDVPVLASYFVRHFNAELARVVRGFSPEARDRLMAYHWPGNVRELKNVIERAILLESTDVILPEHLPMELTPRRAAPEAAAAGTTTAFVPLPLREVELDHIRRTLEYFEGNKSRAAKCLGISRQTLRDKLAAQDRAEAARAERTADQSLDGSKAAGDQIPAAPTRS